MLEIVPAATLILLRDAKDGPPEILMVERGQQLSFAGGNMVFPGGRVDPEDALIAADPELIVAGPPLDPDDMTARIAAIRETIEEVGLAPAIDGLRDSAALAEMRAAMAGGRTFGEMMRHFRLRLDPYQLHPFARWLPKVVAKRVFDTRFYVARAPDHDEAIADGTESLSCHWATAAAHMIRGDAGSHPMIFPTRRNLERIGQARCFDSALAFLKAYPVETVSPWMEQRDGEPWLCIPDHLGYPVTGQPMATVKRG